ncbi:Nucleoporin p54, putative [Pediculus humanus corporis]|uniref:Nucleoporin p54, putative n=1 Tax=Pediculus humanus subsp. corporis TaxID=121224 RepID=E0VJX7_PEDHC|nr:Nucleoporin p54, putative [Pediculus humanus corporis]EEB13683.1 Nucleoporin p54, putative [Pediculus humanus corporis]
MNFNFSNTSSFPSSNTPTLNFGSSTTAKPFGSAVSTLGTSSNTPSFGASTGSVFGNTSAAPTFGSTSSSFGTTPAFGTTNAAPLFGSTSTAPAFGTSNAPTLGTTGTSFGFGGFGSTGQTTSSGLTGFGSLGTTNPTSGTTGFSTFGSSTPSTGLFQGFGSTNTAPGTGLTGFGTGLGTKPATTFSWGSSNFNLQPQQNTIDPNQALYNAVFNCQVFGDERDRTLSRWNLVQALWGTGKGYYSQQAPPVEFNMKNPLCRFKAVCYSKRPRTENKDGLVALIFNKKESEIRSLEAQLLTNLNNILGNKCNLVPSVESIKAFSETKTLVIIYVEEKIVSSPNRKIPALELSAFLTQPMQKQQLTNLQVENIYPQVDPGQESLKEYLDNPPAGFDARLWKQAQEDNPMPDKLIPVPLVGFADVRWRMKCQEQETALHQAFLDKIAEEVADLQRKHTETLAKISEYRLKFSELQHRILKIMIIQEISRKMGLSLLPEEEKLKTRFEAVSATVNSASFKNRLATLTEEVKSHSKSNKEPQRYKMDSDVIADIKQFLTMEQSGMTHVINIIQADLSDIKHIKDGMLKILQGQIH